MGNPTIRVERLSPEQAEKARVVWRVCKRCGDQIPPSAPNHAYCDEQCKKRYMMEEMS